MKMKRMLYRGRHFPSTPLDPSISILDIYLSNQLENIQKSRIKIVGYLETYRHCILTVTMTTTIITCAGTYD